MAGNKALSARNRNSADEFYTQLTDIEDELRHYRSQFQGKVVLCNCDDPFESNFFKYFAMNFNHLGLKKLISTSYAGSPITGKQLPLFDVEGLRATRSVRDVYKVEITEVPDLNADGAIDLLDVEHLLRHDSNAVTPLEGDGDFRSPECVALLDEADIIVTNPPWSLIRDFIPLIAESKKQFLVIGDQNFITYREVFEQIMADNLWFGYNNGGTKWFRVPDDYEIKTESRKKIVDGVKYFSMGRAYWFTNLDTTKRHEPLTLFKRYTPEEYPTYTNYPAIEVSKVAEIPMDYDGEMGVPITFLDKYNPEQFKIIGNSKWLGKPMSEVAEKGTYQAGGIRFYVPNGDGTHRRLYERVVIQRIGATS
ncbi:adenine-specific methyltransferase EcoRI family protein [Oceanimonas marisflavi]|uniref:adenine-specific methyltransferase EcoRI family protein n=1 Tax=Oceanimonas marisflavi TaxID=2059724 RepID=UPI000D32468C|nr:adenine-specific methyltransferase EcoRI family protein [Oceanimonas marisflavi]